MSVGLLLHHIETFTGVVVLISNLKHQIDKAFFRRFRFVLEFPVPDVGLREQLWRLILPKEAPVDADVDIPTLASRWKMAGGSIKSAVMRAATRAAIREEGTDRIIRMADLLKAAEEEDEKESGSKAPTGMFN